MKEADKLNVSLIKTNIQKGVFPVQTENGLSKNHSVTALTSLQLLDKLLIKNFEPAVWKFIIRRDLINDLEFIHQIYFEDIYFTTCILLNNPNVVCLETDFCFYFYRKRNSSILNSKNKDKLIFGLKATITALKVLKNVKKSSFINQEHIVFIDKIIDKCKLQICKFI